MKFNKSVAIGLGLIVICGAGLSYWLMRNSDAVLSQEQAQEIILQKVPNGNIVEIAYENDDTPKYNSKVSKDNVVYEVDVDAKTGDIVEYEQEIIQNNNTNNKTNNSSEKLISEKEAQDIMLKKVPDATIKSIHLDKDHDGDEYKGVLVKSNEKYEITVNAKTKEVKEFSHEMISKSDKEYGQLEIND